MLSFFPGPLKGSIIFFLFCINTLFWGTFLLPASILKLVIPVPHARVILSKIIDLIASLWITVNNLSLALFHRIEWDVSGIEVLDKQKWYLVICNHQSWVDILVLQKIFNFRIPFLKFFLKKELIWVPVMGILWWALDYPFMKRYSSAYIKKHPHLAGKDILATKKACEKFKAKPVSIMNFMEGTRFHPKKHEKQQSPYRNLLIPKAGGISFALSSMEEFITGIVNVTIFYPEGVPAFWEFLCGKTDRIVAKVEFIPRDTKLFGDYFNDPDFKNEFQNWVNNLWQEKDELIEDLKKTA